MEGAAGGVWAVRTRNVRRLQVDWALARRYRPEGLAGLRVDGLPVAGLGPGALPTAGVATLRLLADDEDEDGAGGAGRREGWAVDGDGEWRRRERAPGTYGPAAQVFEGPVAVVHGAAPWMPRAALHLAQDLYAQGRYDVRVVAAADEDAWAALAGHNLVLLGGPQTNPWTRRLAAASRALLGDEALVAFQADGDAEGEGSFEIGGEAFAGPGLGVQVRPHRSSPRPGRSRGRPDLT